jgi:gamma-glutamyl:cysteine ligase YbdK (ATP-grasp superfamily)|tara:strand:- start:256 stop:543 length:288 start_codon:yes stop_codon:yes gene_type:complete
MSVELKILDKEEETSKEVNVVNYLKAMLAIEQAMEPYKEQKKELRKEYIENGWLTRQDIWSAIKALRLYEQDADMDDLNDMFETVEKQFGSKNEV